MKRFILTLFLMFPFVLVFAQQWTKEEKQACFEMMLSDAKQIYGSELSDEDLRELAGCAVYSVTSNYSASQLEEKAEFEKQDIYKGIIKHCRGEINMEGEDNTQNQNSITFRNNTGKKMSVAYAKREDEKRGWVSYGWLSIEPYQFINLDLGDYTGALYVCGRQLATVDDWLPGSTKTIEKIWGNESYFCVDFGKSFTIFSADKIQCSNKRLFSSVYINAGENEYIFNPK